MLRKQVQKNVHYLLPQISGQNPNTEVWLWGWGPDNGDLIDCDTSNLKCILKASPEIFLASTPKGPRSLVPSQAESGRRSCLPDQPFEGRSNSKLQMRKEKGQTRLEMSAFNSSDNLSKALSSSSKVYTLFLDLNPFVSGVNEACVEER